MEENYLLSVIIPAYNASKYLQRAIKSIVAQRYAERIQVLVLDDGSTDDTLAIAQDMAEKYQQVTVIHKIGGVLAVPEMLGLTTQKENILDSVMQTIGGKKTLSMMSCLKS